MWDGFLSGVSFPQVETGLAIAPISRFPPSVLGVTVVACHGEAHSWTCDDEPAEHGGISPHFIVPRVKKQDTKRLSISQLNIDGFSQIFHWYTFRCIAINQPWWIPLHLEDVTTLPCKILSVKTRNCTVCCCTDHSTSRPCFELFKEMSAADTAWLKQTAIQYWAAQNRNGDAFNTTLLHARQ